MRIFRLGQFLQNISYINVVAVVFEQIGEDIFEEFPEQIVISVNYQIIHHSHCEIEVNFLRLFVVFLLDFFVQKSEEVDGLFVSFKRRNIGVFEDLSFIYVFLNSSFNPVFSLYFFVVERYANDVD